MRDYVLFTDSTCDLTPAMYREAGLSRLMLHFQLDGKVYPDDGETLVGKPFYDIMRRGLMPSTMQINVQQVEDAFRPHLEQGRDVLYLAFASALSGSYQSACMAAETLRGEFPDAKIYVVDSTCACGGEGRFACDMSAKKRAGLDIDALRDWLEENKKYYVHLFTVNDLNHLHRGGRVSKTAALAGTMLGIKPVMYESVEGKLCVGSKVRGRKAALQMLVDRMLSLAVEPAAQEVFINHSDCPEDAQWLEQEVRQRAGVKAVRILPLGPVIGTHTGPGCISLFFVGRTRVWE